MPESEGDALMEFLKSLDIDLPEKGLEAPEIEIIEDEAGELRGTALKITFDVFMFMNHRQAKYFMLSTNQSMRNLGDMSLKEALEKFNSKQQRKKR